MYQVYDISEDYGNMYKSYISAMAITQVISTANTDILSVLVNLYHCCDGVSFSDRMTENRIMVCNQSRAKCNLKRS